MSRNDLTPDKNSKNKVSKLSSNKKQITATNLTKLQNARIIQKHLVYVIGLSSKISSEKVVNLLNIDFSQIRIFWTVWTDN